MTKSLKQMVSLILVLCLCFSLAAPVMAASGRGNAASNAGGCVGQTSGTKESEGSTDPELILIEDETTVSEDTQLRAATYAVAPAGANSRAVVGAAEASYSLASPTYAELASSNGTNMETQYYWSADGNTYYPVRVTRTSETETSDGNGCPGSSSSTTYYSFTLLDDQGNELESVERITKLNSAVSLSSGALYTQGPLLKYFPVTMLNYDQDTINAATAAKEISETVTEITQVTTMPTWSSLRATTSTNGTYTAETAYLYEENGEYYPVTVQLEVSGSYLSRRYAYSLIANGNTIASASGSSSVASNRVSDVTLYVDANADGAKWNGIYFGPSGFQTVSAAYRDPVNGTNVTRNYAVWNYWTGYINDQNQKQQYGTNSYSDNSAYVYQGLVEDEFENGNIKFTVPDAGIFDINDTSTKDVYTNVGLPFVYEDGYYTFNAKEHSARFVGGAASNKNLTYSEDVQIGGNNDNKNGFFPFNDKTGKVGTEEYHFGMVATIPFSMTSNGKISSAADAEDIVFSFAGDDDVWVFIDGKLVLDLGGIHDSADGEINFAANTTTVKRTEDSLGTTSGAFHKDGTVTENEVMGQLFNDANGKGILNTDIETFAATDEHTLTIYYLERGQNESNCKIRFNLPMKDYVSVKKVIDGQAIVEKNGDEETVRYTNLSGLSAEQINVLNNLDFGFTLCKDGEPVKNASYNLYDANNQYVNTPSTDSNGHFTLKNGETARFITSFDEAESYFVVEDIKDGFIATNFATSINTPSDKRANVASGEYTYYKLASDGYHYVTDINGNKPISYAYTVVGSDESEDSIAFVCNNYMNASLPRPSAIPADDAIVIDYGLPVVVDLFANDMYLADTIEISFPKYNAVNGVYTAEFGTFTYDTAKKSITYTLNEQLTGVEKIEYILTGTAIGENNELVTATGTANVYIIPATSMYYEEDFGFVNYTAGTWNDVENSVYASANQEPGVVGTTNDSPYGSDAAYLSDNHDSNGTSKYVDTAAGSASFNYTFTGTGTTFFARTTGDSAYMRVQVYDKDNNLVSTYFRDTSFKDENGNLVDLANNNGAVGEDDIVLYNIPVYTWDAEDVGLGHGEYKVVVSIAKKTFSNRPDETDWLIYGDQFWLDGIKVINPLDPELMESAAPNSDYAIANGAYSTDGEANMTVITLRDKLLTDGEYTNVQYEPVYVMTKEYLYNEDGTPVYVMNEDGNMVHAYELVRAKDEQGNDIPVYEVIYETDENGEFIYDKFGKKIPMYEIDSIDEEPAFEYLYKTENGELKLDAAGNPIPTYKFEYLKDEEGNLELDKDNNPMLINEYIYERDEDGFIKLDENRRPISAYKLVFERDGDNLVLDAAGNPIPVYEKDGSGNLILDNELIPAYKKDGNGNPMPEYLMDDEGNKIQVYEEVIYWNEGKGSIVFTDTNGEVVLASEYKSNGPKEEVYLNNGQKITFSLYNWDANANKMYLGIKAPVGSGRVIINDRIVNINNAADCYYEISSYATITTMKDDNGKEIKVATFEIEATDGLISVTNLKITGNVKFAVIPDEDIVVPDDPDIEVE